MSNTPSRSGREHAPGARHVLMVVHDCYPLDARAVREARAAAQAGYRVDVICLTDDGEARREAIDGIHVHRIGVSRKRGVGLGRMLREYVEFAASASFLAARIHVRHRGASERVVQIHAPPDFLIVAGIVPKLLGGKLILDIHDLTRHLYLARFAGRRAARSANRLLASIERAACAIADRVITVHEPYRRELIANGVADSSVVVVMNAVDDDLIARVERASSGGRLASGSRPRSGATPFTIAYHGSIIPAWGVNLIVEALPHVLESVPDLRCLILGAGDALGVVKKRAAELGVTPAVEFSGRWLPIEEALGKVADADCGLIPNVPSELNRFALSSKLFEYVALGVPAVVARLETLASHFEADEVTFFEAGDAVSLARAVTWVATNPEAARAKAERALTRSSEYSWPEQRSRYLDVLRSAAGAAKGAGGGPSHASVRPRRDRAAGAQQVS